MIAHLTPSTGTPQARVAALTAVLPQLETPRCLLRPCRITDWSVLAPIWTTERARHIGGPFSPEDAWLDYNQLVASWLLRGYGPLTITDKADNAVLGMVLLAHEQGDPAPELGWLLTEAAEGRGIATEAAQALRDWGFAALGRDGFVSYVAAENAASRRVAEKLGAAAQGHHPGDPDVHIYRYGGAT